jgi:hypothetical protein
MTKAAILIAALLLAILPVHDDDGGGKACIYVQPSNQWVC